MINHWPVTELVLTDSGSDSVYHPLMSPKLRSNMKSLEELSAAKAIRTFSASRCPVKDFKELESVQQELIFKHLLKDHGRLIEIERTLKVIETRMPDSGFRIHTTWPCNLSNISAADYYLHERKDDLGKEWSYISFDQYQQLNDAHSSSGTDDLDTKDIHEALKTCSRIPKPAGVYLEASISSQLLLYRLICLFGMPSLGDSLIIALGKLTCGFGKAEAASRCWITKGVSSHTIVGKTRVRRARWTCWSFWWKTAFHSLSMEVLQG